jgi:hypothetical protein
MVLGVLYFARSSYAATQGLPGSTLHLPKFMDGLGAVLRNSSRPLHSTLFTQPLIYIITLNAPKSIVSLGFGRCPASAHSRREVCL